VVVPLLLSTQTKGDGRIVVLVESKDGQYGQSFTTFPETINKSITLHVSKGAEATSLTFIPVDNDVFNEDYHVTISIGEVSGVVQKGKFTTLSITVTDNEVKSIATFKTPEQTIPEQNTDGGLIEIALSTPAAGTGTVAVNLASTKPNSPIYGTDFVTIPAASYGVLTLPVADKAESVNFKVVPINTSKCQDLVSEISLVNASGAVEVPGYSTTIITIKDDDISFVNFTENSGLIGEGDAGGIEIHLNLSQAASEDATLYIGGAGYSIGEDIYGTVYSTEPALVWDGYDPFVPLPVVKGATNIGFKLFPVDNAVDNSDISLPFWIAFSSNNCLAGNGSYALTITDDD
jgi:hypothetical protein